LRALASAENVVMLVELLAVFVDMMHMITVIVP
jgi:hypothetical protein